MREFNSLLKKDFLELKRTKKWLIFLLSFAFVTVISVLTAKFLPEIMNLFLSSTGMPTMEMKASIADSYVQFIANIGEVCVLLVAIIFSITLVKEKTSGTAYLLKSNGVKDHKVVLSHFLSKFIFVTISYLVSVALFVVMNLAIFKEYAGLRGVVSLSYLYLTLLFSLVLGIFISSVVKKKSLGYILTISIYFILTILSMFPYIDIYNPMSTMIMANNIIINETYELKDYLINLFVTLGVIVAMLIASIYTYKNQIDNRK